MIFILSPSKTLNYDEQPAPSYSLPRLRKRTAELVDVMREKSPDEIGELMDINEELARTNWNRYRHFDPDHYTQENAKQSLLAFKGHVYHGMKVEDFSQDDLEYAQDHLRILSGLYGLLRPLDYMQPYRLEMGTRLKNPQGKNLYEFWGEDITELLNKDLQEQEEKVLVNLASQEYFKAVKPKAFKGSILDIAFKEWRNDKLKVVSVYAKMARGMMCHYAIKNRVEKPEQLKGFDYEGYSWSEEHSTEKEWVFARESQ